MNSRTLLIVGGVAAAALVLFALRSYIYSALNPPSYSRVVLHSGEQLTPRSRPLPAQLSRLISLPTHCYASWDWADEREQRTSGVQSVGIVAEGSAVECTDWIVNSLRRHGFEPQQEELAGGTSIKGRRGNAERIGAIVGPSGVGIADPADGGLTYIMFIYSNRPDNMPDAN